MYISLTVIAFLLILLFVLWDENRVLGRHLGEMEKIYHELTHALAEQPKATAQEIADKSKKRHSFTVHGSWSDERARLEAQYPDKFEQYAAEIQKQGEW